MERIEKLIAHNTACSRQEVKKLIREGRVFVNEVQVQRPGLQVDPQKDRIRIDDLNICARDQDLVLMLNKPCGYITSRHDPSGHPSVFDLLPEQDRKRLHAVGRLDVDSCGLLLFVSDGALTHRLTHPKHHVEKEYIVALNGLLTPEVTRDIENGILLDGEPTLPCKISNVQRTDGRTTLHIVLREGKYRQIRRMFEGYDLPVSSLQRVRMGSVVLKDLPEGRTRELSDAERASLA